MTAHANADPLLDGLARHPSAAVGYISTVELAKLLGKATGRAGRDWCKRHSIPYRRDGKVNWVRIEDVRRVLEGLPANDGAAPSRLAAIRAGLHRLKGGR
jgi:hypothetical protein